VAAYGIVVVAPGFFGPNEFGCRACVVLGRRDGQIEEP
jgi:hypothetical protein